jgi:hypothetical protein
MLGPTQLAAWTPLVIGAMACPGNMPRDTSPCLRLTALLKRLKFIARTVVLRVSPSP